MQSLSLSTPTYFLSLQQTRFLPKINPNHQFPQTWSKFQSPLQSRGPTWLKEVMGNGGRGGFGPLTTDNLQWISTISTVVLMFTKGTAIQKSFLVPLFALQAPAIIVSWMRGEYGIWTAFLALLIRLFFSIPEELDLPLVALLVVIVAPYQAMNLRGTVEGLVLYSVIAGYITFQHFSRAGSLRKAFELDSIVATLAIICTCLAPCLFLIELFFF